MRPALLAILLLTSIAFAQTPAPATPPDSTKLIVTHFVKPVYPLAAARQQIQGEVMVHLVVDTNGNVESAEVVSGEPLLRSAALDAVRKWKFQPYIRDGHPIKAATTMPVDFAFDQTIIDHPEKDKGIKSDVPFVSPDTKSPAPAATTTAPSESASSNSAPAAPQAVHVGQAVSQGMLLRAVRPVYPSIAMMNHVQGVVLLRAVIGKNGRIEKLRVVSGPKELAQAAVDAVQQWRYRPYMLNNEPVTIDTMITVNFALR